MRQTIAIIAISVALGLVAMACAETDVQQPELTTQTATVTAQDGETQFKVTVTTERSHEIALEYLANIVIEAPEASEGTLDGPISGVEYDVPPKTEAVDQIATDGGFNVDVEQLTNLDKLDDWRWNFDDLAHATGFCPPGH